MKTAILLLVGALGGTGLTAHAASTSAAFTTQITLNAPSTRDLCLNQTSGSINNPAIRVICSGTPFVSIGPATGVLVLSTFSSSNATTRANFGPKSTTPTPWADFNLRTAPAVDIGTITSFGISSLIQAQAAGNAPASFSAGGPITISTTTATGASANLGAKTTTDSASNERPTEFLISF